MRAPEFRELSSFCISRHVFARSLSMTLESLLSGLERLAIVFGPWGAITLIMAALIGVVLVVYMLLSFGHEGVRTVVPYISYLLNVLREEPRKRHPAIRVEVYAHGVLAVVVILSLCFLALHALVPWIRHDTESTLIATLASSLTAFLVLTVVSIRLGTHLN